MKLDRHGIRFRFWLAFFFLAVGITILIGLLQIGLIRPYYRNEKIRSVKTLAEKASEDLIFDNTTTGISDAMNQAVNNNACVLIYNAHGSIVYQADSLGAGCIFNASDAESRKQYEFDAVSQSVNDAGGKWSARITNPATSQETILYGEEIPADFGSYYIIVNSPLEPVDSIVTFFANQYLIYTLIAIAIASLVAFYVARLVTRPVVNMKKEAQKLAKADYSASFDGGSFTETKELAAALNNADEKLGRIDEMRRDVMANLSHDMRTPLTNIRAYAEMIQDISGDNKEKREKHLNVIIKETDYMNRLINDMTELSAMQSGNMVLHKTNVDLVSKIREIAEMDQPLLNERDLHLHISAPASLTVYADEVKISQVIANYISNAIKHTPDHGSIEVRAYVMKDEETVHLEVEDTGEGIDPEDLPYIWDRYQKSSRTFSRSQTSTGLGLSIVRAIMELHHGKYGVNSKKGKGSVFWIELPKTDEI